MNLKVTAVLCLILWMGVSYWFYLCHIKGICPSSSNNFSASNNEIVERSNIMANKDNQTNMAHDSLNVSPLDVGEDEFDSEPIQTDSLYTQPGESVTNKTLYSDFDSTDFKADDMLESYGSDVLNFLEKYPHAKVVITGHSDSIGPEETNYWVAMQRAENVKNYFVSRGVEASKITIDSKGELMPVADNNTANGRRNNRRIVVTINH